jgi:hypothetical protein
MRTGLWFPCGIAACCELQVSLSRDLHFSAILSEEVECSRQLRHGRNVDWTNNTAELGVHGCCFSNRWRIKLQRRCQFLDYFIPKKANCLLRMLSRSSLPSHGLSRVRVRLNNSVLRTRALSPEGAWHAEEASSVVKWDCSALRQVGGF